MKLGTTQSRAVPGWSLRYTIPWKPIFIYLAAIVTFIYLVGPFSWIVISSFMTREEAMSMPPHWL
ncbi:MAG: hypothetical protein KDE19_01905, partial [Caldilineaceae bacterium]|nr:hypothetical protein [Caldilineaceae bacterium]